MTRPCLDRRLFLAGGLAGLVAGCAAQTDFGVSPGVTAPVGARPRFDASKALVPEMTRDLRIAEVSVRLAPEFTRTAPHNGVTREFILEQMRQSIVPGLAAAKPAGAYPVRAEVEVLRFNFANVAVGLVGPKGSLAAFRTTLFYADDGQQVGRAATTQATTPLRPTLLGLVAIKAPPEEVRIVARRAPKAIAIRFFGRQGS